MHKTRSSSSQLILRTLNRALLITLFFLISTTTATADTVALTCSAAHIDLPFFKKVATAGFFANYRNKPGSVSFESEQTFRRAELLASDLHIPASLTCPKDCKVRPIPYMLFRSLPQKYRSGYRDEQHCKLLEKVTAKKPLVYSNNKIKTVEDLISWIGELTQGKGKEGSDLYERCDKSCSPRYEYQITKVEERDETYAVTVSIVCGDARDKDDDMYNLDFFFRWVCEEG